MSCDLLETWEGDPAPFDNTRDNKLNPANPVVATLMWWISTNLREIVEELDEAERNRKKTEEAKKLSREAQRLSKALNEDFRELRRQLAKIQSDRDKLPTSGQTERPEEVIGEPTEPNDPEGAVLPGEGDTPTEYQQGGPPQGEGTRGSQAAPGDEPRPGSSILPGNQTGGPHKKTKENKKSNTFTIEFVNETAERERSHYDGESRTIYVNLDHPQLAAARNLHPDVDSEGFRQVAYEVAFVEYALALMTEEALQDQAMDPHDVLFDVRRTVNRVAARIPELLD